MLLQAPLRDLHADEPGTCEEALNPEQGGVMQG